MRKFHSDSGNTRSTRFTLSGFVASPGSIASTIALARVAKAFDQMAYIGLAVLACSAAAISALATKYPPGFCGSG
ncbi:Uncharacterised protein [Vibrio cholerae]|nr:Uncharacterised protein [Vibrio cholerae]CSI84192.1 Uncharacterised protein [Vibrio cholerae]